MTFAKSQEKESEQKRLMESATGKSTVLSSHIIANHFEKMKKADYPMPGEWQFEIKEGKLRSA